MSIQQGEYEKAVPYFKKTIKWIQLWQMHGFQLGKPVSIPANMRKRKNISENIELDPGITTIYSPGL